MIFIFLRFLLFVLLISFVIYLVYLGIAKYLGEAGQRAKRTDGRVFDKFQRVMRNDVKPTERKQGKQKKHK